MGGRSSRGRTPADGDGRIGATFGTDGHLGTSPATFSDPFDTADTLRRRFPKLVRIFALGAIDRPESLARIDAQADEVETFLAEVASASADRFPATGLGEDLRFNAGALTGAALIANGHVEARERVAKWRAGATSSG